MVQMANLASGCQGKDIELRWDKWNLGAGINKHCRKNLATPEKQSLVFKPSLSSPHQGVFKVYPKKVVCHTDTAPDNLL